MSVLNDHPAWAKHQEEVGKANAAKLEFSATEAARADRNAARRADWEAACFDALQNGTEAPPEPEDERSPYPSNMMGLLKSREDGANQHEARLLDSIAADVQSEALAREAALLDEVRPLVAELEAKYDELRGLANDYYSVQRRQYEHPKLSDLLYVRQGSIIENLAGAPRLDTGRKPPTSISQGAVQLDPDADSIDLSATYSEART
jgi:hypothetical protein